MKCPVCGGELRIFRMMYLRGMYWYAECKVNVSHYHWPSKCGCDTPDELRCRLNAAYYAQPERT